MSRIFLISSFVFYISLFSSSVFALKKTHPVIETLEIIAPVDVISRYIAAKLSLLSPQASPATCNCVDEHKETRKIIEPLDVLDVIGSPTKNPYTISIGADKHVVSWSENQILGSGAFAKVFKGRLDGKPVAVKVISVLRALQTLGINLPNHDENYIPTAFGVIEKTCLSLLKEAQRPSPREIAPLARFVTNASADGNDLLKVVIVFPLATGNLKNMSKANINIRHLTKNLITDVLHLFSEGHVHQDIKPENILVMTSPYPRFCLGDLGMARKLSKIRGTLEERTKAIETITVRRERDLSAVVQTILWAESRITSQQNIDTQLAKLAERNEELFVILEFLQSGDFKTNIDQHGQKLSFKFNDPIKRLEFALKLSYFKHHDAMMSGFHDHLPK